MTSNKTLLDLNKVQHGTLFWVNQYGQTKLSPPLGVATVRMEPVGDDPALHHPMFPGETTYHRARRLGLLDVWTTVVTFQLTANHNIQFSDKKALKMWELWKAKIYGKKKE